MSDSMKHTPNQLIVRSTDATPNGLDQLMQDGKDGEWIAWAYKFENARRIVACVNACKGMSTETLETAAIGPNVEEWFQDWSALPAEAHELGVKQWAESMKTRLSAVSGALRKAKPFIQDYLRDCGACDHSAGICICGLIQCAEEIDAALASIGEGV